MRLASRLGARVARQPAMRIQRVSLNATQLNPAAAMRIQPRVSLDPCLNPVRHYRGHNCMDDILSVSEAWHSLVPERKLDDEGALRAAFDKLDLDGSGKIDAYELKTALREGPMSGALEITEAEVDAIVAAMISYADINADGEIDFDEYKRIIKAGCEPGGRKRKEPRAEPATAAASS